MTFSPPDPFPAPSYPPPVAGSTDEAAPNPASPVTDGQTAPAPRSEWSPVGIISALGVIFVLISGLSVTLRQWGTQGEAVRAIGLSVLAIAATLVADRIRTMAHTTGLATAVLGAAIGFPAGVACAAWGGQPWPICLTVGALISVPVAEWQRRRWPPMTIAARNFQWFDLVQVATLAMGSFGLAAWTHIPAGVFAATAAALLFGLGATRRAVTVALLAVTAPVLGVLADAGIGAGTLARAGVVGDPLGWAGPLVGVVAGAVIFQAGRRLDNRRLQLVAPIAVVAGLLTGLTAIDAGPAVWLAIPGLLLAVGAGTWHIARFGNEPFNPPGAASAGDSVSTLRSLLMGFGVVAGVMWWFASLAVVRPIDGSYAITAFVWAVGLGLCWPIGKRYEADAILIGVAVTPAVIASALASILVVPTRLDWLVMVGVAVVSVGATAIATRSAQTALGAVPPLATSYVVVAAAMIAGDQWVGLSRTVPFALVAIWLAAAVYAFWRFSSVPVVWLLSLAGATAVGCVIAVVTTETFAGPGFESILATMMFAVLAVALASAVVPASRPLLGVPVGVAGATMLLLSRVAEATPALAVAFVATALWAVVWSRTSPSGWAKALVGGSVGAAAMMVAAVALGASKPTQLVGVAGLAIASGWIWWRGRSITALMSGTVVAFMLISAVGLSTAWMAASWCAVGLATIVVGVRWKQSWAVAIGVIVAAISGVVWAMSFGIPDWLADALDAVDLTTFDIVSLAVFIVGLGIARWALGKTEFSSVGLFALPFGWVTFTTIIAEVDRHPVWVVPFAVVAGVVSMIVGIRRKLAGPLLWGVVLSVSVIVVSSRLTLVLVPGWVWIGAGGVALLATALVVERVAGGWSGVRRQAAYLAKTWR